jgi:hypothetical protein
MCATSIYHSSASHVKPRRRANLPLLPSPTGGQPARKCFKKYLLAVRSKSSIYGFVIDKYILCFLLMNYCYSLQRFIYSSIHGEGG